MHGILCTIDMLLLVTYMFPSLVRHLRLLICCSSYMCDDVTTLNKNTAINEDGTCETSWEMTSCSLGQVHSSRERMERPQATSSPVSGLVCYTTLMAATAF